MPAGRPPIPFDAEIGTAICDALACSDKALSEVLEELGHPITEWTFYKWQRENDAFSKQSAHARESQGHYLADKAIVEARTSRLGTIEKSESGPDGCKNSQTISDNVQLSQLICQTYFKRAGQLNKALGDKLAHTGADGEGPVGIQIISAVPRPERK
jgi:hypothetical protein